MKKGFTLIELLAVILILGIIAVIAIPIVNKIVYDSKKSAFETTTQNIINAIEDACQLQVLKGESITKTYTFTEEGIVPKIDVKGKLPTSGIANVDSNCKVSIDVTDNIFAVSKSSSEADTKAIYVKGYGINLTLNGNANIIKYIDNNNYNDSGAKAVDTENNDLSSSITTTITKNSEIVTSILKNEVAEYTITYSIRKYGKSYSISRNVSVENRVYTNGTAVYFNPVTGLKCLSSEAISTNGNNVGCMKWYTFNDSGKNAISIDLILDHNTTSIGAWGSIDSSYRGIYGPIYAKGNLCTETNGWVGVPLRTDYYVLNNGNVNYTVNYTTCRARLITANEVAKIIGKTSFNELTSPSNSYTFDSTISGPSSNDYAWLFDNLSSCTTYGCNSDLSGTGQQYSYWTATLSASDSTEAWDISYRGVMETTGHGSLNSTGSRGVRPVITINKSVLE